MVTIDNTFALPGEAIESLAGPLTSDQAARLSLYASLVAAASHKTGLVSKGDREKLGEHLVDSAALLRAVDVRDALMDLGSGAGLPGLVVAVLRPRTVVTLVESKRRRVAFLKKAVRELEAKNVRIIHGRLEGLSPKERQALTTSRALGSIERTLAASLDATAPGGRLVLFKGPAWPSERERAEDIASERGARLSDEIRIELPGLERATTFVVFHVKHP